MGNKLARRNGHERVINTPSFLLLASMVRLITSFHVPSAASLENDRYFLASFPSCLTWVIWQFYFANSIESIIVFSRQWARLVPWQRLLFGVVGILLLPVAYIAAVGLLQFSNGPSPSAPLKLAILTPAMLWTVPVLLSVTLTISGMSSTASVQQMQERASSHIVHLLLYIVFLCRSQLDKLAGAGSVSVYVMFSTMVGGFMVQILWHACLHTHLFVYDVEPPGQVPQQQEQEGGQNETAICTFDGGTTVLEIKEESAMSSELVLPTLYVGKCHISPTAELVFATPLKLPQLSCSDEVVICRDELVPLRQIPDAICRFQ